MITLAIVAGIAITVLGAIILAGIRAVRATVRDVTPQLRMAPPAKQPPAKDDAYLPGPPFASDPGAAP